MKFCAWCGQQIADDDVFCANCGKRADGSDAPAQQPQQTPAASAPQQQPQWQQPVQQPQQWQPQWQPPVTPPPQQRGKGALIGGIIAAVVVVAVLVGGFVWPGFFKKDKPGEDIPSPLKTEATEKPVATPAPKATDAPKATEAPKETEAPKPVATPEPTPAPTPEPTPAPYVNTFTDVHEGDWYYDAVLWAGKNGIVSGTEFKPGDPANRGQALTFLWRAAGEPETILKVSPYTDVREGDWYYTPVLWGFENGLISTASDGQFHADGSLTRAQAITFLCRALEGAPRESKRNFSDVREGDWYFDTANWALENGVVGRDSTWGFYPDQTVTRAQFVTFLHRAYDPSAKKADNGTPAPDGFREHGIPAESATSNSIRSLSTTNYAGDHAGTLTSYVVCYEVFEEGYDLPRRDGWEYHDLDVYLENYYSSDLYCYVYVIDYYNTYASDHGWSCSEAGDAFIDYVPIVWNGEIVECEVRIEWCADERGGHDYVTAQVPKGYDGLVFTILGTGLDYDSSDYLIDYYDPAEVVTYRLDGRAD